LFGLPLSPDDFELFRQCTARREVPEGGFTEAWLIVGRRGGKSMVLALIACFLAVFRDWRPYLSPGETGTIKVIATDRKQARVIHRYCRALLTKVPAFAELIARDTDEAIELNNAVRIEIQSASFRTTRGYTVIAALCDELAYWRSDEGSANPDSEIINALKPAMATIPGAFFLAASSPYARRGELWNAFRRWHGDDEAAALIWHADTRTMNPTVRQSLIDEALEEDPAKAGAEYLATFRTDIESFVSQDVVEAAVALGRYELSHMWGVRYFGFVDPSGAAVDSMTLAIAHKGEDERVIVDLVRERRPPFSPESVVTEFSAVLKIYRVREIEGDRWGGEWPREAFAKNGITYTVAEKVKSAIYTEFLPLLNSGRVELLDHSRMVAQLVALERRTGRGSGRDSIDHPPGGHDDVINAVAGAAVLAAAAVEMVIDDAVLTRARSIAPRTPRHGPARRSVRGLGF
jgi:hypothetical protein